MAYLLDENQRRDLSKKIAAFLPEDYRENVSEEAYEISNLFEGQDQNAIGVLYYAAEAGEFNEYAGKLKDYHAEHGAKISSEGRLLMRGHDVSLLSKFVKDKETGNINPNFPPQITKLFNHLEAMKEELFFYGILKKQAESRPSQ